MSVHPFNQSVVRQGPKQPIDKDKTSSCLKPLLASHPLPPSHANRGTHERILMSLIRSFHCSLRFAQHRSMPRSLNKAAKYVVLITPHQSRSNHLNVLLGAAQFPWVPYPWELTSISSPLAAAGNNTDNNLPMILSREIRSSLLH